MEIQIEYERPTQKDASTFEERAIQDTVNDIKEQLVPLKSEIERQGVKFVFIYNRSEDFSILQAVGADDVLVDQIKGALRNSDIRVEGSDDPN